MTKTTRPMVRIHDTSTDEIIDREMNNDEFAKYEAKIAEKQIKDAEIAKQDLAKSALLNRLGITAEEAALLLS